MSQANLTTLKRKKDFKNVFRRGRRLRSGTLLVIGLERNPPDRGGLRFGFQIRRKIGKAVSRNRLRRRLKEAARSLTEDRSVDWDIVIIATPASTSNTYRQTEKELDRALVRLGVKKTGVRLGF